MYYIAAYYIYLYYLFNNNIHYLFFYLFKIKYILRISYFYNNM